MAAALELTLNVQAETRRRRTNRPRPASALPSNASEAGSGTTARSLISVWPRLISEPPSTKVPMACSVIENKAGSVIGPESL